MKCEAGDGVGFTSESAPDREKCAEALGWNRSVCSRVLGGKHGWSAVEGGAWRRKEGQVL